MLAVAMANRRLSDNMQDFAQDTNSTKMIGFASDHAVSSRLEFQRQTESLGLKWPELEGKSGREFQSCFRSSMVSSITLEGFDFDDTASFDPQEPQDSPRMPERQLSLEPELHQAYSRRNSANERPGFASGDSPNSNRPTYPMRKASKSTDRIRRADRIDRVRKEDSKDQNVLHPPHMWDLAETSDHAPRPPVKKASKGRSLVSARSHM